MILEVDYYENTIDYKLNQPDMTGTKNPNLISKRS